MHRTFGHVSAARDPQALRGRYEMIGTAIEIPDAHEHGPESRISRASYPTVRRVVYFKHGSISAAQIR